MTLGRLTEVRSLTRSFRYAASGIAFCVKNERNMRVHLTVTVYVLVFSTFYQLTGTQYILLLCTVCMVLFAEAVNTSIEAVVNMNTQCYDSLARIAKDVAAGAVLICALFAAVIGCILFLKPAVLMHIVDVLFHNIFMGGAFLISLPVSAVFIFFWPRRVRTVIKSSRRKS